MGDKRYPVLSKYSHLIYKMVSDRIYPSKIRIITQLESLAWVVGIETEFQHWTMAMLEEVEDKRIRERLLIGWDKLDELRCNENAAYYEAEMLEKDSSNANTEAYQIIGYMLYQIEKAIDSADSAMNKPGRPSYSIIARNMRHRLFGLRIEVEGWRDHGVKPEYMEAFLEKKRDNP